MEIKKHYEDLAKKYKLPSFDIMDKEFEIAVIDPDSFLLREIRRKIAEKIGNYNKILESILQPETNACDMYECNVFDEDEKSEIFRLFKQIMFFDRYSIETSINEDDQKTSKFIIDFLKEWIQIKEELSRILSKLKESWKKEIKINSDVGYMG